MSLNMVLPKSVKIVEVGPRDGLQNESAVSIQAKVKLINQLSSSGLTFIEAGAFVSPKWVPQMADSLDVMQQIRRDPHIRYSALTPNLKGLEKALIANASEVAVFTSASEGFCKKNINCSIEDSLARFKPVIEQAKLKGIPVRGYLSCIVDCPYDGPTNPDQVAHVAKSLIDLGCYEVSLGDTIGTATPMRVAKVISAVSAQVSLERIAVHFHDTYGQALANIYQSLQMGVRVIDSSVAGLGGCPYAAGASGNVATEDVVYLCHGLGIETGIDLHCLAQAGWEISEALGRKPTSKVSLALRR